MSDLLNQASLVMVPSGYKEDTVYSVVPSDGSGDLSFTRASNGTRINSAGLVEVCPWNLLQYSENFTSGWITVNSSITANSTTAPNGTTTADTFTLTASSDSSIYQPVNGSTNNYSVSIYAKYVSGDKYLYIFSPLNSQSAKVWFDIQNGTVSNQLSGFTGTIENAGDGWYRCSLYNTNQAVLDYIQLGISTTNSSRILSNNSVSYIWGAQINTGALKPYFPTTDRLNVPRLTYQNGGGGCPSLLLEKQSTNLVTYSEQFDNAAFSTANNNGTVTRTANYGISPDGTQNADRIQLTRGSGSFDYAQVYQQVSTTSGTHTFSCWIKSLSGTPSIGWAYDGAVWNVVTLTNEWVRYTWTTSTNANPSANLIIYGSLATPLSADFLVWGYQIEASSYPTSYIPTTTSSATRVADACYKTGISSLIGQTEGVLFADLKITALPTDGSLFGVQKTASNFVIRFGSQGSNIYAQCYNGSTNLFFETTSYTLGTRIKMAFAYKAGSYAFYINGTQIAIGTNATSIPACDEIMTNSLWGNTNPSLYEINEAVLFPTRLTNAELASLTTI